MSTILEVLVHHGAMLAASTTLLLFAGVVATTIVRAPARVVRLGEAVLASTLLFVALAICPLPRWSFESARDEPVAVNGESVSTTPLSQGGDATEASLVVTHANDAPVSVPTVAPDAEDTSGVQPSPALEPHSLPADEPAQSANQLAASSVPTILPEAKPTPSAATPQAPLAPAIATSSDERSENVSLAGWLAAAYLVCAGVCIAWLAVGFAVLKRTLRRATRPADWLAALYESLPWESSRPRPAFFVSADLPRPVCYGLWHTVIVIPAADCREESREQLRHVLLHELAHAEHRDGGRRVLACISLPVLYFHPLYWLLRGRIEFATEVLADQRAARHSSQATYAEQLVAWASTRKADRRTLWGGASVLRSPTEFYRRMALLLRSGKPIALECSRRCSFAYRAASFAASASLAAAIGVPIASGLDTPSTANNHAEVSASLSQQRIVDEFDDLGLLDTRTAEARAADAIEAVSRYAERLKSREPDKASSIESARLYAVQWLAEGKEPSSAQSELHVVSASIIDPGPRANRRATVEVTWKDRPIVLLLHGTYPTRWTVKAHPGVRIAQIVLAGQSPYSVAGLPENVPIASIAAEDGGDWSPIDDRLQAHTWREQLAWIRDRVGLPIASVIRPEQSNEPAIVGPENTEWRAQRALFLLKAMRAEALLDEYRGNRDKLADVRFDALHLVVRDDRYDPSHAISVGKFTIDGPIAMSLRPVSSKVRHLTRDSRGREYCLYDGKAAFVNYTNESYEFLKHEGETAYLPGASVMAYDAIADRLIVWGESVYCYDVSARSWRVKSDPPVALVAATYSVKDQTLYGLELSKSQSPKSDWSEEPRAVTHIVRLDSDGQVVSRIALPMPILTSKYDAWDSLQLASAGDTLVVVRKSYKLRHMEKSVPTRLFVLAPATGRILWTTNLSTSDTQASTPTKHPKAANLTSVDGANLAQPQIDNQSYKFINATMIDRRPLAERLPHRLAEIERAAIELRPKDAASDERIAEELKTLRSIVDGDYSHLSKNDKQAELHVVSVYEGQRAPLRENPMADVVVNYTQRPVVLALVSYYPIQWNIRVADGARVERVIVSCGRDGRSSVRGVESLTNGPKIDILDGGEQNLVRYMYSSRRYLDHDLPTVRKLRELTDGLEVATVLGQYKYTGTALEIGPSNAEWRMQHALHLSAPIHNEAMQLKREERWAEVSNLRFFAVHSPTSSRRNGDEGGMRSLAKYTPIGPVAGSLQTLTQSLRNVAIDPWEGTIYGTSEKGVFTVDRDTGNCDPLPTSEDDEPIADARAIAFDSKRKRLLVWGKSLHIFDPAKGTWSHRRHSGQSLHSVVYSEEDDLFYGIDSTREENGGQEAQFISRINNVGALIERVPLSHRIYQGYHEGTAQIGYSGGRLVLLIPSSIRSEQGQNVSHWCYTVDRRTGEIIWASPATTVETEDE